MALAVWVQRSGVGSGSPASQVLECLVQRPAPAVCCICRSCLFDWSKFHSSPDLCLWPTATLRLRACIYAVHWQLHSICCSSCCRTLRHLCWVVTIYGSLIIRSLESSGSDGCGERPTQHLLATTLAPHVRGRARSAQIALLTSRTHRCRPRHKGSCTRCQRIAPCVSARPSVLKNRVICTAACCSSDLWRCG